MKTHKVLRDQDAAAIWGVNKDQVTLSELWLLKSALKIPSLKFIIALKYGNEYSFFVRRLMA